MCVGNHDDPWHDLNPEQRAYLNGFKGSYNLAAEEQQDNCKKLLNEMRNEYEKLFEEFKDKFNARTRAMEIALARLEAIDAAINTQRESDTKLQ